MDEFVTGDFFNNNIRIEEKIYRTFFTRGCPFGCTYCCNNYLNKLYSGQNIFRKRSVDNVIEELKKMKQDLPFIKVITFTDDNFFGLSLEEIKEFSEKYKKDIKLLFTVSGTNPFLLSREKLRCLVSAGLTLIRMGIQTGSEKTKKLYKRQMISNSQIEKSCRIMNESKDQIQRIEYDVIIDNPWETEEDLIKTLRFLVRIPVPYSLIIFSLTFCPGTEIYDLAKKEGLIKNEIKDIYRKNYWNFQKVYLNNLFALLAEYARKGKRIHSIQMFLLTNKLFRKLRLSLILYHFLRIRIHYDWSVLTIQKIFNKIFRHWKRIVLN